MEICNYIYEIYDEQKDIIKKDVYSFLIELHDNNAIKIDGISQVRGSEEMDSSENVESEIIELLRERGNLYCATLEVTYSCNEKCVHCYATYPDNFQNYRTVEYEDWKRVIDELYEMKCFRISFTGGDPFMLPHFIELMEYAHKKGFILDVFTNGVMLAEHREYIERVQAVQPRAFYISVYGSNAATHDSITQVKGTHEKTLSAIKSLRDRGIPVVINIMLLKSNAHEAASIVDLAKKLGAEYRIGLSIIHKNNGDTSPLSYFINDADIIENILRMEEKIFNIDMPLMKKDKYGLICGAGTATLSISPYGNVYPCLSLNGKSMGSIFEKSLIAIWENQDRKAYVNSITWENTKECMACKLKDY